MSDVFSPRRAILDVLVDARGNRTFFVELEIESSGLIKVWDTASYEDAQRALTEIGKAAGVPIVDAYSLGVRR